MPVNAASFRDALARVPAPVTIITTLDWNGRPAGFTASAVCALDAILPVGDHSILVGRVQEQARMSAGAPLVYFDRRFHRLEAAATPGRLAGAAGSEVSA